MQTGGTFLECGTVRVKYTYIDFISYKLEPIIQNMVQNYKYFNFPIYYAISQPINLDDIKIYFTTSYQSFYSHYLEYSI